MNKINKLSFENRYRRVLIVITGFFTIMLISYGYILNSAIVPTSIKIVIHEEDEFNSLIPVTANFDKDCVGVISVDNKLIDKKRLSINLNKDSSIRANKVGKYKADIKAFGVLSLKKIDVEVIERKKLTVGGLPVGIYVETDGLLVLGTVNITGKDNVEYNPAKNILKSGDYIIAVNGKQINNKQKFIEYIQEIEEEDIDLTIRRNNQIIHVAVKKIKCKDGSYKIGAWIRNNMQGVGTLTYYDRDTGKYAALGHGINDVDTNKLMEIKKGSIYTASILNIVKGLKKEPGELVGLINYNNENQVGTLNNNTSNGIFGEIKKCSENKLLGQLDYDDLKDEYFVGLSHNVVEGKAKLRCTVGNIVDEYDIKILKTNRNNETSNKNFILRITDKRLLNLTNGIVQGMSGSPIIQNNKIIGALTHVFVNDPTKGYGIYIENMLG